MRLVVSAIVRNETDRHLAKMLACAVEVVRHAESGQIIITDDASTDNTAELAQKAGAVVRVNPEPVYWRHEGEARQEHYDFMSSYCDEDTWVLALDGDETVSHPDRLTDVCSIAEQKGRWVVGLPLYEFWSDTEYRVDGWWFGTKAARLYRWRPNGKFNMQELGGGSEPLYSQLAVQSGLFYPQDDVHLLHWGYVKPEDRVRKHALYTGRLGGHGHNNTHVESIITHPTLRTYV